MSALVESQRGGVASVAKAREKKVFDDKSAGADNQRDQFTEDTSLDQDAIAEHENNPDRHEPQPGTQARVGQPVAHHQNKGKQIAAGGEQLRPGMGEQDRFDVPVETGVELGAVRGKVMVDERLPGDPVESQGSYALESFGTEKAVETNTAVLKRLVEEVERKKEEGSFAIDGGDEKEAGEPHPGTAEIDEIEGDAEEGEAGEIVGEAEVLDRMQDVGGSERDERKGIDERREEPLAGAGLVDAGGQDARDRKAGYVDEGLDEDLRLDGTREPEVGDGEEFAGEAQGGA